MAINSHNKDCKDCRGSERSHSGRVREDAKANGIRKRLTNAEYDEELAEIREHFNKLKMRIEESQRVGWLMKKRVNWQPLQLRLRQKKISLLRGELRVAELKEEISACESEQSTDEEWRPAGDLVRHIEDLRQ